MSRIQGFLWIRPMLEKDSKKTVQVTIDNEVIEQEIEVDTTLADFYQ